MSSFGMDAWKHLRHVFMAHGVRNVDASLPPQNSSKTSPLWMFVYRWRWVAVIYHARAHDKVNLETTSTAWLLTRTASAPSILAEWTVTWHCSSIHGRFSHDHEPWSRMDTDVMRWCVADHAGAGWPAHTRTSRLSLSWSRAAFYFQYIPSSQLSRCSKDAKTERKESANIPGEVVRTGDETGGRAMNPNICAGNAQTWTRKSFDNVSDSKT